jgi:hypothetical protein
MKSEKKLRRVIRLGTTSLGITLPPTWLEGLEYVWIERSDSAIIIRPAEVK